MAVYAEQTISAEKQNYDRYITPGIEELYIQEIKLVGGIYPDKIFYKLTEERGHKSGYIPASVVASTGFTDELARRLNLNDPTKRGFRQRILKIVNNGHKTLDSAI